MSASEPRRMAVASTTVAMLFNSALGLAAQLLLADKLGPGTTLDQFITVTTAPLAVIGIGQTALLLAIVPPLSRALVGGQTARTRVLLRTGVLLAWSAALIGLMFTIVAPNTHGEGDLISAALGWLMCGFGLTAHVRAAALATNGTFARPVVLNAFYPLSLIITCLVLVTPSARTLVAAYAVASASHLAVLLMLPERAVNAHSEKPHEARGDLAHSGRDSDLDWRQLLAAVAATLPSTALPLSDVYWSVRLESGALSLLTLGLRFTIPLCALATSGLAYVSFPSIARTAASGSSQKAREEVLRMGLAAFTIMAPIATIGVVLRSPALSLVMTHGEFTTEHTRDLVALLPWYLLSTIGTGVSNAVLRSLFIFDLGRRVAALAVASTVFYIGGSGLLIDGGANTIAMLYAVTWTVFAGTQLAMLGARVDSAFRSRLLRAGGIAAASAGASGALCHLLILVWPEPAHGLAAAARVASIGTAGLACCALLMRDLGARLQPTP